MNEEGRVPRTAYELRQRRRAKGAPVQQPQEAPDNAEYRRNLRRQRNIWRILREKSYREGE